MIPFFLILLLPTQGRRTKIGQGGRIILVCARENFPLPERFPHPPWAWFLPPSGHTFPIFPNLSRVFTYFSFIFLPPLITSIYLNTLKLKLLPIHLSIGKAFMFSSLFTWSSFGFFAQMMKCVFLIDRGRVLNQFWLNVVRNYLF